MTQQRRRYFMQRFKSKPVYGQTNEGQNCLDDLQKCALNFINKMKVYSASKLRRVPCQLNEVIKTNITQLASLLKCTSSQSLSLTPSMQSLNAQEEAISLAKQFVSNLSDPFQCMILYPLVLDCSFTCPPDPLFKYTSFPQELHSLLSLYLYKCTSYPSLDRRSRKVIDLFYRYVSEEGGQAYETWLGQDNNRSLGEWFQTECISSFFQLLYKDRESYTIFLTNYLKHGLAYLFLSATTTIKGAQHPPQCESGQLDRIRTRFIGKHNID